MRDALTSGQVRLRPVSADDAGDARRILATPEVSRWWGDPDEQLKDVLQPADDTTTSYAIEVDGIMVGFIQSVEEPTPQYRHAGIDLAVDPAWHGRGVGSHAIYALARYLIQNRGHHRLTIDPAADNEVAIRVYRRLGFRPVGTLREYERGPDGSWHDGLLMDMLAPELTAPPARP